MKEMREKGEHSTWRWVLSLPVQRMGCWEKVLVNDGWKLLEHQTPAGLHPWRGEPSLLPPPQPHRELVVRMHAVNDSWKLDHQTSAGISPWCTSIMVALELEQHQSAATSTSSHSAAVCCWWWVPVPPLYWSWLLVPQTPSWGSSVLSRHHRS